MKKNKIIELTPKEFRCAGLGCPSVFSNENGELFVIGEFSDIDELPEQIRNKVGKGESVVKIPKGLITGIKF
ncbi:hypothetical protein [Flagellimonas onchidii]|uniref:hypothetical protein n=1 Tax=Flagellimonas onchidii TaxID=2562684 RepID=UPI0010A5D47E|nr:hypothetical protein [Allomuricauda onchidii]